MHAQKDLFLISHVRVEQKDNNQINTKFIDICFQSNAKSYKSSSRFKTCLAKEKWNEKHDWPIFTKWQQQQHAWMRSINVTNSRQTFSQFHETQLYHQTVTWKPTDIKFAILKICVYVTAWWHWPPAIGLFEVWNDELSVINYLVVVWEPKVVEDDFYNDFAKLHDRVSARAGAFKWGLQLCQLPLSHPSQPQTQVQEWGRVKHHAWQKSHQVSWLVLGFKLTPPFKSFTPCFLLPSFLLPSIAHW